MHTDKMTLEIMGADPKTINLVELIYKSIEKRRDKFNGSSVHEDQFESGIEGMLSQIDRSTDAFNKEKAEATIRGDYNEEQNKQKLHFSIEAIKANYAHLL